MSRNSFLEEGQASTELNLPTNKFSGRVRKQVDKQSEGTKKTGKDPGIWERRQARVRWPLQGRSDPMKRQSEDS